MSITSRLSPKKSATTNENNAPYTLLTDNIPSSAMKYTPVSTTVPEKNVKEKKEKEIKSEEIKAEENSTIKYTPVSNITSEPKAAEKKSAEKKALTIDDIIHKPIEAPTEDVDIFSTKLKDIIQKSTLTNKDPNKQADAVVYAFNSRQRESKKESIIGKASIRPGERLNPNEFLLAHRNKIPEIARGKNGERLVVNWTGLRTEAEELGRFNASTHFFGAFGSYIINVPRGNYAKAWTGSNNQPIILDEGIHVIHDTSFRFDINDTLSKVIPDFKAENIFVDQSSPYVKHGTLHILRVAQGQLAKVIVNGKPKLLEPHEEPYIFNTANFQFNPATDLVSQAENYISHQNLHILRVPQGFYAKITIDNIPRLLEPQNEPYIFDTPRFTFNKDQDFVSQNLPYIQHGNIHVIRVRTGFYAKIFKDGTPQLLASSDEPYVFVTPNLIFNKDTDFVSQSANYIQHGIIHILRIPEGCIAKVWEGNTAKLLHSRSAPYIYTDSHDSQFTLERPKDNQYLFEKAGAKLIEHGPIKRIIPSLYEVAVTSNEGKLEVIDKLFEINSPTHSFVSFLPTSLRTLSFPSEKTKLKRQAENKAAKPDEINYEIFTTSDSLKVGIKLLVAYQITDPKLALSIGLEENIIDHIEGLVTADMAAVIQSCTSQEFLSSNQARSVSMDSDSKSSPSAPLYQTYRDTVKEKLEQDLALYGITLKRLNIDESKVINNEIASKMEQLSLNTAKASAEYASLQTQGQILKSQADQAAQVSKIKADRENQRLIDEATAKAEANKIAAQGLLEAAQINAQALMTEAKARNDIAKMEADTRAQIAAQQAEQYRNSPELLLLEMTKIRMEALKLMPAQFNITSSEFDLLFSAPQGLTSQGIPGLQNVSLFSRGSGGAPQRATVAPALVKENKPDGHANTVESSSTSSISKSSISSSYS